MPCWRSGAKTERANTQKRIATGLDVLIKSSRKTRERKKSTIRALSKPHLFNTIPLYEVPLFVFLHNIN